MTDRDRLARYLGVVAGSAGLAASSFVLFGPVMRYRSESTAGGVETGTISGIDYLLGNPNADLALFAWPVLLGILSVVGAVAAWRGNTAWTGGMAATLVVFVILGIMTIGFLYAPAAVLMGLAAVVGRD
jgi:hypothetical protein